MLAERCLHLLERKQFLCSAIIVGDIFDWILFRSNMRKVPERLSTYIAD